MTDTRMTAITPELVAKHGITPASLAAANGLAPNAFVIAGTSLKIPAVAPA